MRSLLKSLVPPIFHVAYRALKASAEYGSWDDALSSCGRSTYESETIVNAVVAKNFAYQRALNNLDSSSFSSNSPLVALGLCRSEQCLRVLDFGGGGGSHYSILEKAVRDNSQIYWYVVETPQMTDHARRLERGRLRFLSSTDAAKQALGTIDLIFTSSALQYCEDPISTLKSLTDIGARFIYITRTPLAETDTPIYSTQSSWLSENGPGRLPENFADTRVTYPIVYAPRSSFERTLSEKYSIVLSINEGNVNAFRTRRRVIPTRGYFCALR